MKERIIELLLALGETPREIADKLLSLSFKGRRMSACRCPIANYLKHELQVEKVWVDGAEVEVRFGDDPRWVYLWENTPDDIIIRLGVVRSFINNFDIGDYPELVEARQ